MGHLSQIKNRTDIDHFGVALLDPKNSFNVGGALRATGAFGGSYFVAQGNRWETKGDWRHMDTEGAHIRLPTYFGVKDLFDYKPYGAEVVYVERTTNAISLPDFTHPKVALYVFGPEDGALPATMAVDGPRVYIPSEYSLNLYAAVTAVLYDRTTKLSVKIGPPEVKCPNCNSTNWRFVYLTGSQKHCNACGQEWVST